MSVPPGDDHQYDMYGSLNMIGRRHRLRPRTALQHAYWQKWVEGYGMLSKSGLHALLQSTPHVEAISFWTIVA
jgi:hypothetical protein